MNEFGDTLTDPAGPKTTPKQEVEEFEAEKYKAYMLHVEEKENGVEITISAKIMTADKTDGTTRTIRLSGNGAEQFLKSAVDGAKNWQANTNSLCKQALEAKGIFPPGLV